jgi:tryptophan synthase beta subunit
MNSIECLAGDHLPDGRGRFGFYGGRYAAETLMPALAELERAYQEAKTDPAFQQEYHRLLREYAGRPSLLYKAERISQALGLPVYLKREDLNHTGAHKINNVLGQVLLARRMGKTQVIAETGAGQHGVATATAAALFGMTCDVFMGVEDTRRQALNVYRMELLGARVHPVSSGTGTLKDATSEAMREWARRADDTYYVIGSTMGPHPYPMIVRDFQRVIGDEIRSQLQTACGRLPAALIACVGGGSNAMGTFYPFINDPDIRLIGAEAAGEGVETGRHAATMTAGSLGVFHGMHSLFLQTDEGQIKPVYSISAGLDYPGIGPEHVYLQETRRAEYHAVTDAAAVDAFGWLARLEGIIPAIESSHALALLRQLAAAGSFRTGEPIVVSLSGRGDKDVAAIQTWQREQVAGAARAGTIGEQQEDIR